MQAPSSRLRGVNRPAGYSYLLSLPPGPDAGAAGRRPLLLFLHGIGERGTEVWRVALQGLPKLLHGQPGLTAAEQQIGREVAAQFIVVAPQCPRDEVWDSTALLALLDEADREFQPDPARIYVTGLSLGGYGTWRLGMRQPGRFAAIAPICGGGSIADITTALRTDPVALQRLPVWAFHGAKDRVVPPGESARMVAALKAAGLAEVKYTLYPEAEHDSWSETYANQELYSWLLAHSVPRVP
jgi:predicted peptidase